MNFTVEPLEGSDFAFDSLPRVAAGFFERSKEGCVKPGGSTIRFRFGTYLGLDRVHALYYESMGRNYRAMASAPLNLTRKRGLVATATAPLCSP